MIISWKHKEINVSLHSVSAETNVYNITFIVYYVKTILRNVRDKCPL